MKRQPQLAPGELKPLGDRVIVRRLPQPKGLIVVEPQTGMLLVSGVVLAAGPGKYDDDGDFIPTTVKAGQKVIFNARWNDFAHAELKGSDCDQKGPLERPLPLWANPSVHLIQESDIAGVLS